MNEQNGEGELLRGAEGSDVGLSADRMDAGPWLDALVCERVFGWEVDRRPEWAQQYHVNYNGGAFWVAGLPKFSTDISEAWRIVELMHHDGFRFDLWVRDPEDRTLHGGMVWGAEFSMPQMLLPPMYWKGSADTAPMAICRAALKVAHTRNAQLETVREGGSG